MRRHIDIVCLAGSLLLTLGSPARAGPFEDAKAAYDRGDYATELAILRPNAAAGQVWAQANLGDAYFRGLGVARDESLAASWFRKAAEQGSITQQMIANRKLEAAKANVQAVIAAPEPVMEKAKGQTTKQVLRYEVTDILALVKARPDLCKIEAKASAINSTCHPNLPIPGLKLWFENVSTYTTR